MEGKFYGVVGFVTKVKTKPGVYTDQVVEKKYSGNLVRNWSKKFQTAQTVNDNITINNDVSILADPFANENFRYITYVEFMGVKWKVVSAEIRYPRLYLTLGGEYNGV